MLYLVYIVCSLVYYVIIGIGFITFDNCYEPSSQSNIINQSNTMYTRWNVEHNSKIDNLDEIHNNSLNNRRTSSKYPNTFIYPM
jgi:hypothetical protein